MYVEWRGEDGRSMSSVKLVWEVVLENDLEWELRLRRVFTRGHYRHLEGT